MMKLSKFPLLLIINHIIVAFGWISINPIALRPKKKPNFCLNEAVGIFYGTSTGSTQECADKVYEAFLDAKNDDDTVDEPVDIDTINDGKQLSEIFNKYDALIVGTPTWNTGADVERSGTGWDELYYNTLPDIKNVLTNKNVAVFGLGDQISYSDNYADATGELFHVFKSLGCNMVTYAYTSQDGYEHENSKSIIENENKFCGLLLDMVNQEELTDERIQNWVDTLIQNGFLTGSTKTEESTTTTTTTTTTDETITNNDKLKNALEESSVILDENIATHSTATSNNSNANISGFTPYHNTVTGKTMWVSQDGRKSFVTTTTTTMQQQSSKTNTNLRP